jgi:hypothetical protein
MSLSIGVRIDKQHRQAEEHFFPALIAPALWGSWRSELLSSLRQSSRASGRLASAYPLSGTMAQLVYTSLCRR